MSLETLVRVGSAMTGTYLAASAIQDIREKARKMEYNGYHEYVKDLVKSLNKETWMKLGGAAASYYLMYRCSDLFAEEAPKRSVINFFVADVDSSRDLGCYDRDDPINEAYKAAAKIKKLHHHHHHGHHRYDIQNSTPPAAHSQPNIPRADANQELALGIEPFEMEVMVDRLIEDSKSVNEKINDMFVIDEKTGTVLA